MTISVCMATYNGENYVREQLSSILEQLGPEDEVIVCDDGSTDATIAIIEGMSDSRVAVHRNGRNLGYTRNFERALGLTTGDVIFVADQDDVWLPGKVTTMLEALEDHDLAVSDVVVVDGELNEIHPSHFRWHGVKRGFVHNLVRTRYIGSSMAMRRSVLDLALPLPSRADLCAYDYWLTVVSELYLRVALVQTPLMLYRRHDATASTGGTRSSPNPVSHRIKVRLYSLACLAGLAPKRVSLVLSRRGTAVSAAREGTQ
jgi:glycosyltransferase involved in cell wall biosynthesis